MSLQVAAAVSAAVLFFLWKSRRNYVNLKQLPMWGGLQSARDFSPAKATVIIPARNEEQNIKRAVTSFPGLRVLVVNDASQDRTEDEAAKAGAEVIQAPPLPEGELGKPNACQAGAAASTTEWLLFVDADTWYQPTFAAALIDYAERENLDIATAFLRQVTQTAAERIILPYAFALYFCGVSAARVNNPYSKEALANGQCLLIRRAAYQAIGGHKAVAKSVIEDVALAQLAKSKGLRIRVLRAENQGSVRMYDGFPAIRRGFEKNSFRFLGANPLTGVQVMLASTLLASWIPILLWLLAESHLAAALLFAAIPSLALIPWYGSLTRALPALAAIYAFQAIAISAMVRTITGIGTSWKGRRV